LGLFDSETDAARAYNAKASELFGEFAYLNDIPPQSRDSDGAGGTANFLTGLTGFTR